MGDVLDETDDVLDELAVQRLVQAATAYLISDDLDEEVHEAKSEEAADINNGGLESQVRYLVSRFGEKGAREIVERVMGNTPEE